MFRFFKRNKLANDGVFLNRKDGYIEVIYSEHSFLQKGELLTFNMFCEALPNYKRVLLTNEVIGGSKKE